jgi:hypothetical protein
MSSSAPRSLVRVLARAGGKGRSKPLRVQIVSGLGISTSAASGTIAYTSALTLNTSNVPEFGDFAILYDQVRCTGVALEYMFYPSVASTGTPNVSASVSLSVGYLGNPASIGALLNQTHHAGPFLVATENQTVPLTRYHTLNIPLKATPGDPGGESTQNVAGNWNMCSYSVAGSPTVTSLPICQVNAFCGSATTLVMNFVYFARYSLEFRLRE